MNEAIKQFLDREFEEIKREHQLKNLFSRYKKLHSEKIDQISSEFQVDKELVIAALYCSDYVVVASEIKEAIGDEKRVKEIIELFKVLDITSTPSQTGKNWLLITYIVAFIYKMSSLIRKRYYFMLDKGVSKAVAAAQVGDLFIYALLKYCNEVIHASYKWLGILAKTALTQGLFSQAKKELERYMTLDEKSLEYLLPQIIAHFVPKEIEGETNRAVPLQYFDNTFGFYFVKLGNREIYQSTEGSKDIYVKAFKKLLPLISREYSHSIKYLRINTKTMKTQTEMNLFLVHSSVGELEGWLLLYSPIDDINLSLAEELLELKINELRYMTENKNLLPTIELEKKEKPKTEEPKLKELKEKRKVAKKSFLQKILSIFKKKKEPIASKAKIPEKPSKNPLNDFKELFMQQFIVGLVSGIDLGINVYDAYREQEFEINGILESSMETSPPTVFYAESKIEYPSDLLDPIISSIDFAKDYITTMNMGDIEKIIPQEAFFEVKGVPEKTRVIELDYNEGKVVGIVADKYIETHLISRKHVPKYKRRTVIKKVREILSASKRNKMEDVIRSLFTNDINPNMLKKSTEEGILFFCSKKRL